MIFGPKTEKNGKARAGTSCRKSGKKEKPEGHGRNGAADYSGAETMAVSHQSLCHCDPCPACEDGRLYLQGSPGVVIRIKGCAPLQGTIYELEKLRCNICGKIFTADLPPETGTQKYDESASAMLAVLRYGSGLPLNRLAGLQAALGIPLAASTQWEVTEKMADRIHPVFNELIRQAAQGEVVHNDDTTMKILELMAETTTTSPKPSRTGGFTTGILSILDDRRIAMFSPAANTPVKIWRPSWPGGKKASIRRYRCATPYRAIPPKSFGPCWRTASPTAEGILSRWPTLFPMHVSTSWKYWGR